MGVQERLSFESVNAHSLIGIEHRHRYEFAARACDGLRVLDLCCGVGYGSAILADHSMSVLGVDNDAAAVDSAKAALADRAPALSFEVADAGDFLRRAEPGDFDMVVCFEGLEHLVDLEGAIVSLERLVEAGTGLIASVPNSTAFRAENEFHVTDFSFEDAARLFARFRGSTLAYQSHAEGSFIRASGSDQLISRLSLADVEQPEYANNVLVLVGEAAQTLVGVDAGMQLAIAPVLQQHVNNLERSVRELHFVNARLTRAKMGHGDAAAGAILSRERDARELAERERDALRLELDDLRTHFEVAHPYALMHDRLIADTAQLAVDRARIADEHAASEQELVCQREALAREREALDAEWGAFNSLRGRRVVRLAERLLSR